MRNSRRAQREAAQQKKIVFSICFILAVGLISSIMFGSIKAQAASTETTYKYYTSIRIESGDTLWDIANEYVSDEYADKNEYMNEVCEINHISADEIHAGQYIVVPYYSADVLK